MVYSSLFMVDFATEEDLLDRLREQSHGLAYLIGSAVTQGPPSGGPGVPGVEGVIEEIRASYGRAEALNRFEQAIAEEPDQRYQAAFRHLQRTGGQDVANKVIRRCTLRARIPSETFPQVHREIPGDNLELCSRIEDDLPGWHLPPAVEAFGQILASVPGNAHPIVLTSNFDPLVSVSVRRAGGQVVTTALQCDGGFTAIGGKGTLVVHFHGDWFRSDTLHTEAQLSQDRPNLSAALRQLLGSRTLAVFGYGGGDDIFTRSLVDEIRGDLNPINVLWAFHSNDAAQINSDYARLIADLRPGIARGRVVLYKGIDVHVFLPRLARDLGLASPSPKLIERAKFLLTRRKVVVGGGIGLAVSFCVYAGLASRSFRGKPRHWNSADERATKHTVTLPVGAYRHRKSGKVHFVNEKHELLHIPFKGEGSLNQKHLIPLKPGDVVRAVRKGKISYSQNARSVVAEYTARQLLINGQKEDAIAVMMHAILAILDSAEPKETNPPRLADLLAIVCYRNGYDSEFASLISLFQHASPACYPDVQALRERAKKWLDTTSEWHFKWSPSGSKRVSWDGLPM